MPKQSNQEPDDAAAPKQKPERLSRNWKKILGIAGAVGVVIVLVIVVMISHNQPKLTETEKAGKDLVISLQKKDAAAFYEQLSSATKKSVSQEEAQTILDQTVELTKDDPQKVEPAKEAKKAAGAEKISEKAFGETESVEYDVKGKDNKTYRITVTLVRENGAWKVLNFNRTTL